MVGTKHYVVVTFVVAYLMGKLGRRDHCVKVWSPIASLKVCLCCSHTMYRIFDCSEMSNKRILLIIEFVAFSMKLQQPTNVVRALCIDLLKKSRRKANFASLVFFTAKAVYD